MLASINKTDERLFSLDVLKAISITAVVSHPSIFVPVSTYVSASYLIDVISAPLRFCVPVFFTISFLLLERELQNHSNQPQFSFIKKRINRLLIPSVFWSILAGTLLAINATPFKNIIISLFQGTIFSGAYYLLVLLQIICLFPLIRQMFNKQNIIITILIPCLFFLLVDIFLANKLLPRFIFILQKVARSLVTYWLSYIALGILFYRNWMKVVQISKHMSKPLKIIALCLTCLIMLAEASWLRSVSGDSLKPFEYTMFSCILSVVVMFLCFASVTEEQLSPRFNQAVKFLSKYSLGIFCINGIISYIFSTICIHTLKEANFNLTEILIRKFFGWIILLTLSLALSIILKRVGLKACVS
jgi:hypothetical protein